MERYNNIKKQPRFILILIMIVGIISSQLPTQNPFAVIGKFAETLSTNPENLSILAKLHLAYIYAKIRGWNLTAYLLEQAMYNISTNIDITDELANYLENQLTNSENGNSHFLYLNPENYSPDQLFQLFTNALISSSNLGRLITDRTMTFQIDAERFSKDLHNSLSYFGLRLNIEEIRIIRTDDYGYSTIEVLGGNAEIFDTYDWSSTNGLNVSGDLGDIAQDLRLPDFVVNSLRGVDITINDAEF
jgi:hypothetical protein